MNVRTCLYNETIQCYVNFHFCSKEESYVPTPLVGNQNPP